MLQVILRVIRRSLERKDSKIIVDLLLTLSTLELCQALIRNQDYGIFQPGTFESQLNSNPIKCTIKSACIFLFIQN